MGDNTGKLVLIPHNIYLPHDRYIKDLLYKDGLASDLIVGEVTAHQVDDQ